MGETAAYAMGMPMVNTCLRALVKQGRSRRCRATTSSSSTTRRRRRRKEFQQKYKLDADGIPGKHTQKKLSEVVGDAGTPAPAPQQQDAAPPPQQQPAAPSQQAPAAPQNETPAINTVYFTSNYGKAGSKTSVAMTAAGVKDEALGDALAGRRSRPNHHRGRQGKVEVAIPDGLKDGTEISATVSGEGLTAETKAKFTVESAPSAGRITSSKIKVGGKDFVDWFNKVFQPKRDGETGIIVHKKNKKFFPDNLATPRGFREVFDNINVLVGGTGGASATKHRRTSPVLLQRDRRLLPVAGRVRERGEAGEPARLLPRRRRAEKPATT